MKEIKMKSAPATTVADVPGSFPQKNLQATEEQIRYAKLSQMSSKDDSKLQEKMKEVSEITRKPPDVVSLALHDCSYDTNLAIQNILEGFYDDQSEGEWKIKSTKNRKKPAASDNPDAVETSNDKLCNDFGPMDQEEQKPSKQNRLSRGGGNTSGRGRVTSSDNWHDENNKNIPDERGGFGDPPEKSFNNKEGRGRSNDRGRGRGRGRGGMRGNMRGGMRGGGRGGFGRGGGSFRGNNTRQNRGGFNNRGGRGDRGHRQKDNDMNNGNSTEESWDVDTSTKVNDKAEDWNEEIQTNNNNNNSENNNGTTNDWGKEETEWNKEETDWTKEETTDWSKEDWGDQPEPTDSIFSREVDWAQLNGQSNDTESWNCDSTMPKDDRLKYLPENIDTAVIRSIPNSSTSGEVTSYQPTDDISRYMNSPSNQFPSSHPEGGLTNTLNDRAFSLPSSSAANDNIHRTISSMPIVSGVTESHKLEQEQLRTSKSQQVNSGTTNSKPSSSSRRVHHKFNIPSQPVVMPRSAQMVNDMEEQFSGLEFGSGPLSPRTTANENQQPALVDMSVSSNHHDVNQTALTDNRHPVAALSNDTMIAHTSNVLPQASILPESASSKIVESTNPIITKSDVLKTPPGFKPLDQNASHYLGSPGRGHSHLVGIETPDPIPFPSSTNRTSPKSSINVFQRNGGLGTSVVVTEQQQPPQIPNYSDQKVYDQHENNINAEKVIAEQKALAEKQFLAEQQLILNEKNARNAAAVVDQQQRSSYSNEDKTQVTNKLLNSQLSSNDTQQMTPDDLGRSDRLSDLPDQRKSMNDSRVAMNDAHRQGLSSKDGMKLPKADVNNVSNKMHPSASNQMNNTKSGYNSSEMLSLTSSSVVQATTKTQVAGKTSSAPPGVLAPMNLYAGVQPGMIPTYQQQALHGYSYDELLQMQRVPMPPYTYDVSMFPTAAAGPTSTRDGMQTYQQANESKFNRGADESSPVNIPQGSPHVAAGNMPTQQQAAYMNAAAGQLPYGYTYAYQPGVLPQGGVYPAFTTQSVYQMAQGKGTQYQTQFQASAQQQQQQQQQGTYNSSKFSGSSAHEYSKANYQSGQVPLAAHPKGTQQNSSSSPSSTTVQAGPRSAYKSQYNQDGKGYLANSPTSMTTQHGIHMHNQAAAAAHAHIGSVNHYLVQPHTNLMTHSGQMTASHISHQQQMDASSHRNQVHQIPFSGNQQKRDSKGSYGSYWLGNR